MRLLIIFVSRRHDAEENSHAVDRSEKVGGVGYTQCVTVGSMDDGIEHRSNSSIDFKTFRLIIVSSYFCMFQEGFARFHLICNLFQYDLYLSYLSLNCSSEFSRCSIVFNLSLNSMEPKRL